VSTNHAVFAAREVIECLPRLSRDLHNDVVLWSRMARASLFAGLAFSNTKTALADSLSYHLNPAPRRRSRYRLFRQSARSDAQRDRQERGLRCRGSSAPTLKRVSTCWLPR
jgi:hypothetical protein